MSHSKERKEKNCLNCNAQVLGRFCQVCGQENIEPKETFWHLVTHFFYDVTHFDGKFFSTVKYLLWKPGFLTYEYVRGKRMTYLHPIRMYVFTSAFFFLLFFTFISPHGESKKKGIEGLKETLSVSQNEQTRLKEMEGETKDSVIKSAITNAIIKYNRNIALLTDSIHKMETIKHNDDDDDDKEKTLPIIVQQGKPDVKKMIDSITQAVKEDLKNDNVPLADSIKTTAADSIKKIVDTAYRYKPSVSAKTDTATKKDTSVKKDTSHKKKNAAQEDTVSTKQAREVSEDFFDFEFYKDEATYLAVQKELPVQRQDGYLKRTLFLKLLHWHDQQNKGGEKAFETLKEKFKHSFPTILFISLPIFAFLLKMLYIRRKKFYYADHGIFAIHVYCATFILLLLYYLFDAIRNKTHWWFFSLIKAFLVIYIIYYTYKAMRNFYEQGRLKTLLKYIFLGMMTSFVMSILILIFFVITAYNS